MRMMGNNGHDLYGILTVCIHARKAQPRDSSRSSLAYTSHKGPNLAIQNRRKLGVLTGSWRKPLPILLLVFRY